MDGEAELPTMFLNCMISTEGCKAMKQRDMRYHKRRKKNPEIPVTYVRKGIFAMMICLGILAFCALGAMLVKLMLIDHDKYEEKAIRNQTRSTSVTASRGTIYDRNMNVLAASSSVENIFLDPLELEQNKVDIDALAENLGRILDLEPSWIKGQAGDTQYRYKMLRRRQAQDVCDQVRQYISENKIIGVHLEPDSMRYYPYGTLAAQLLGFTNTENVGSEGLESYYNSYLEGTAAPCQTQPARFAAEETTLSDSRYGGLELVGTLRNETEADAVRYCVAALLFDSENELIGLFSDLPEQTIPAGGTQHVELASYMLPDTLKAADVARCEVLAYELLD